MVISYVLSFLSYFGLSQKCIRISAVLITLILFILLLYGIWYLSKISSQAFLNSKYFKLRSKRWKSALKETNFFAICGYVSAGFIGHFVSGMFFLEQHVHSNAILIKIINIYFFICILIIINKILTVFRIVHDAESEVPIKGFIQFAKIFVNFFGVLIIVAYTLGKEPTYYISALGVIASVLMIVFKDIIVGLTAGWQLSMNKMIKLGDWIEMPQNNADGEVIDISLTTVYIKNWDNTIVTLPAYDLISKSFLNWRDIQEQQLRRIKRSFNIDIQTIKFVDKNLLQKLQKFELLKDYISSKEKEIEEFNKQHNTKENMFNGRYLTNIGLFRIYCQQYIKTKPFISKDATILVRQLTPTPEGLPLEVYCFTTTYMFSEFEVYQADIFDHLLSVIGEFDLAIFQTATGKDFKNLQRN